MSQPGPRVRRAGAPGGTAPAAGWAALARAALLGALVSAGPAVEAGPRTWVVDLAASQLRFFATSRFVDAEGRFTRFRGTVRLDPERPEAATGELVVEVASVDTRNRLRDDHLRSADFFDTDQHPTATFVTAAVQPAPGRWLVTGALTIRGVTRRITVPVRVDLSGDTLRIAAEFTLNRQDFGIAYRSFLNPIRDEVRVWADLTARPQ